MFLNPANYKENRLFIKWFVVAAPGVGLIKESKNICAWSLSIFWQSKYFVVYSKQY